MYCPTCKQRMFCKDSRFDSVNARTRRRWACKCGVRGTTLETWEKPAEKPKPKVVKQAPPPLLQTVMTKVVRPPKPKPTPQRVGRRSAREESLFDSMDEDYGVDLRELGIDRGFD